MTTLKRHKTTRYNPYVLYEIRSPKSGFSVRILTSWRERLILTCLKIKEWGR